MLFIVEKETVQVFQTFPVSTYTERSIKKEAVAMPKQSENRQTTQPKYMRAQLFVYAYGYPKIKETTTTQNKINKLIIKKKKQLTKICIIQGYSAIDVVHNVVGVTNSRYVFVSVFVNVSVRVFFFILLYIFR